MGAGIRPASPFAAAARRGAFRAAPPAPHERYRLLAEELERKAAELERSNADLEQFAYVASHDLSEPLRMVSSYLHMLERRYGDQLDADAQAFIHYAVDGAARMRALIDDLLVYSRVARYERVAEPVPVSETVDAALRSLAQAIEESGAVIEVDGDLPMVSMDPVALSQVFQNLLSNALKFRGSGTPRIRISAERDDEQAGWRFAVADDGIGIDARHHERVFKMFQRLHSRDAFPGTGIGLAVVRKIVDRHGGAVWVQSRPGAGATFFFTVPDEGQESGPCREPGLVVST